VSAGGNRGAARFRSIAVLLSGALICRPGVHPPPWERGPRSVFYEPAGAGEGAVAQYSEPTLHNCRNTGFHPFEKEVRGTSISEMLEPKNVCPQLLQMQFVSNRPPHTGSSIDWHPQTGEMGDTRQGLEPSLEDSRYNACLLHGRRHGCLDGYWPGLMFWHALAWATAHTTSNQ